MSSLRRDFLVKRNKLRTFEWRETLSEALRHGEARLRVDQFALTANNITYALFGEKMRYWDFFPVPDGFGRIPVWGFADVVESTVEGLSVGERIYGYLPISSEVIVTVGKLDRGGFADVSPWRSELAPTYNRYFRVRNDPQFETASEAFQAVFRPLFRTSYLIADLLEDSNFYNARSVLISSASSKTSLTLGFLLSRNLAEHHRTVGLTSAASVKFVAETGYYDNVALYGHVEQLEPVPTVYVDMAGGGSLRTRVHTHFGDNLLYSCAVGGTHWDDPGRASGLPGAKPTLFFAPGRAEKRARDWGAGELERRMERRWADFCASAERWAEVREYRGPAEVERLYKTVLEGDIPARTVPIASVHP